LSLGRLSLARCAVVLCLASGTLLDAERIMREFVAGLSGLIDIGRAPGGAGEMASYCMVGIAVAGSAGGLAGGGPCGGAGLAWLSARLSGGLGVASCCIADVPCWSRWGRVWCRILRSGWDVRVPQALAWLISDGLER
jgi:hypothetical protein